jgi:hypothetical protein
VTDDVYSEVFLMTNFINLKIKSTQSFRNARKYKYYFCTVFLKNGIVTATCCTALSERKPRNQPLVFGI